MCICCCVLILLAGIFGGCSRHSEYWDTITQVESYIEQRPDSALVVLQRVNMRKLVGEEERAKHSLLLSIAMDKNYIDRTDFDVLQPAIDYYTDRGDATDRLRTLYYQGRIYHNQGNEAAAMDCYLKALEQGSGSDDMLTKARLLVAKGNIYYSLMKWDDVCDVNLQTADIFYSLDRINSYINCNLKAVRGFIQQEEYGCAKTYLDVCGKYTDVMPTRTLGNYYSGYITYLICDNFHRDTISEVVTDYLSSVPKECIDYITLTNAYMVLSDYDSAAESISNYTRYRNARPEPRYYALLSEIYQKQERYKEALQSYITFNKINNELVTSIFNDDTHLWRIAIFWSCRRSRRRWQRTEL